MNIEQVSQLKQRLKSEYEADQAAIERVLKLLGESKSNGGTPPVSAKTVEQKVKSAIAELPAQFTLSDVMGKIASLFTDGEVNRATVSSVIFRLKETNQITLIKAGIGRAAAIYGKP